MVFGMPRALFPALARGLGGGPGLYGLLLSSVAGGAFVASVTSGWTSRVRRQGVALLIAVAAWGTTIAGQPSKDVSSTPTRLVTNPSRVGIPFIRQP
jgi:hypothetical protein